MTLGMIAPIEEQSFRRASEKGLDFVEFCINGEDRGETLFSRLDEIKDWIGRYGVAVGSIGRWKSVIQNEDGVIDPKEQELAARLMEAAHALGCKNYVCGCNRADHVSYYVNLSNAIRFFEGVLADRPEGMRVSAYNCRKMNFILGPEQWRIVLGHLPELGIKYDPSHAIQEGKDYLAETMAWGERFYHVHLKGSLVINGVSADDPPAGLDGTDWVRFLALLRAKGYQGGLSIEPHSKVWTGELEDAGIDYTISYMDKLLARR